MTSRALYADVMLGTDIFDSIVLAAEANDDGRRASAKSQQRTVVLRFDGRRFHGASEIAYPLQRGWSSSRGAAYCCAINGNVIYVLERGGWRTEKFGKGPEKVSAISGVCEDGVDTIYVCGERALYVGSAGKWVRRPAPKPVDALNGVAALSSKEVYVATDLGLLLWEGTRFQELAEPAPEGVAAVAVAKGRVYAGDRRLLRWAEGSGWTEVEPRIPDVMALLELDGNVIVGTYEGGLLESRGDAFVQATTPFTCRALQRIGVGAFAAGRDQSFVRSSDRWQVLSLPTCPADGLPADQA